MSLYYWLIVVTALPCGYFAQTLKQTIPSITKTVGKTARFKCEVEGLTISNNDPLHWYQQKPGQAPTRILYYGSGISRDSGFGDRFNAGKNNNDFYLTIGKVKEEDTATYYCEHFAEILRQFPISITRPKTSTVKIRCVTQHTETIHWYQQQPNQGPRRIIYFSKSGVLLDPGIPSKFSVAKSVSSFFLVIDNIERSDAAIYYCAEWIPTVRNNGKKPIAKTPRLPSTQLPVLVTEIPNRKIKLRINFNFNNKSRDKYDWSFEFKD